MNDRMKKTAADLGAMTTPPKNGRSRMLPLAAPNFSELLDISEALFYELCELRGHIGANKADEPA